MIAKGNAHNNGSKLAAYLMNGGKHGERAELAELRGFGTTLDLKDAFRDVHIMAAATKAEQPLFHVQVRLPDGEKLTREQWQKTANRIERMLGLKDQPRAIVFHFDKETGEEHMHVAWSRIDARTLTAIPMPFYKERLKKLSRELELYFGLQQVTSQRDSEIKFAPIKAEEEQAQRLGIDIHQVREVIRSCFDHSDCGQNFEEALKHEGIILAQGDRRDYLAVYDGGGYLSLGKKLLGATAAQVREKLADIDRAQLPTLEQAREQVLTRELAQVQKQIEAAQQPAPVWDRDAANREWEAAVINAAIENGNNIGGREKTSEAQQELTGPARDIREARQRSDNPQAFLAALAEHGIDLAKATRADAVQSQLDSADATVRGYWKPTFREGEIVAVTDQGQVWKLTERTTGDKAIQNFLAGLDKPLPSIQQAQHQKQREQDLEELKPRGRWATGPQRGGMVEHQAWAMDRAKAAADEQRRREEERRADEHARKSTGEVDPQRYLSDPDYRRQVRADQAYKTPQERKTDRENDLRALLEQQDRQR
jgi:hypothetical protein